MGANFPNNKIDLTTIFLVEILLTFLLMGVILASVHTKGLRGFGGAAIGLIIGLDILFGGNISGASMNPARSLAPALVSGNFENLWIYLTSTFIDVVIAVFVYKIIEIQIFKTRKSSKTRSA